MKSEGKSDRENEEEGEKKKSDVVTRDIAGAALSRVITWRWRLNSSISMAFSNLLCLIMTYDGVKQAVERGGSDDVINSEKESWRWRNSIERKAWRENGENRQQRKYRKRSEMTSGENLAQHLKHRRHMAHLLYLA